MTQNNESVEAVARASGRIRNTFDKRIDDLTRAAIEESLVEIARAFDDLVADRDEWRTQHENLLSVRQSDLAAIAATPREPSSNAHTDLIARLLDGVCAMGLHEDNNTELFDIDGANNTMAEAADALQALHVTASERKKRWETALREIEQETGRATYDLDECTMRIFNVHRLARTALTEDKGE